MQKIGAGRQLHPKPAKKFVVADRGNIDEKEKRDFKELAKKYLNLTDETIKRSVKIGKLVEI